MTDVINDQYVIEVGVVEHYSIVCGFYEHLGFNVVGWYSMDGQGSSYLLLHMELLTL